MGSLPKAAVLSGPRVAVPVAPLSKHLQQLGVSDRTALMYSDETCNVRVSYAELEGRTNALARAIAAHARPQGTNEDGDFAIAMCMQPTHNTIITLLGICKAGGAYLPMEPTFPPARVAHILRDAQPSLVIYDETADPSLFAGSGVPAVSFEEISLEASALPADRLNEREVLVEQDASSVGLIYYTSGSTGVPKGVRMPYAAICNRLWWQFQTFPFADSETTCVWKTALTFVDSVCEIWAPLLNGRTLLILSKEITRDPQKLVRVLAEHQIHRLVLVPTLLRSILMYLSLDPSNRPLHDLKLWVCSGETLSKGLAEEFFQYFGDRSGYRLANFYGSTEVIGDVTYYVIEKMEQLDMFPTIPIGAPINNSAVYLLDEEMNLARQSEPGEIWVAGANLALGYVGGQAPEKFCDNPHAAHPGFGRLYRTGDFGILEKGVILYTGRTDSQVKIRGHRVDLQEIERAVSAVQGVSKAVVLCYGLASGNPEILAFVTIQPNARLAGHMIEAALTKMLINYMIPQVIVIDVVPLLVNGKVDRQALLKMYENTNNNDDPSILLDIDYTGVEPGQMEAARVLFETVGEVLGRAARGAVCVSANFYELGGNSLNSIYTITKLRERGFFIEITDFLNASNLGEILSSIKTNPDEVEDEDEQRFKVEPMKDEHKERVFEMIVTSFYEKAELEQCLINEIKKSDYAICLEACWAPLLTAGLSRVLTDASGTPVAVALNFDARDEPEIDLPGGLGKIMAFLEHVEGSVRDTMLPEGKGTVLHAFMMATAADLSPQDNVLAIRALEMATEQVARDRRYLGVFTTNTSPLTQQLGQDVLGYQTLVDCQINQYVDCNGLRVFAQAPDDMHALVCWKPVQSH